MAYLTVTDKKLPDTYETSELRAQLLRSPGKSSQGQVLAKGTCQGQVTILSIFGSAFAPLWFFKLIGTFWLREVGIWRRLFDKAAESFTKPGSVSLLLVYWYCSTMPPPPLNCNWTASPTNLALCYNFHQLTINNHGSPQASHLST